jgi:hypothetical protein
VQSRLGVKRRVPDKMPVFFGSQWWCLTYPLAMRILKKARRKDIERFFKRTWVPDEMFFQTLAASLENPVRFLAPLTYYKFDSTGKPIIFYDDHYAFLKAQPHFFARKIAPHAEKVRTLHLDAGAPKPGPPYKPSYPYYMPDLFPGDKLKYYENLLKNNVKYAIVFCYNAAMRNSIYKLCKDTDYINFYYNIFNSKAIVYGAKKWRQPYYSGSGAAYLRNQSVISFVVDLMTCFANSLNVICVDTATPQRERLFYDKKNVVRLFALPDHVMNSLYINNDFNGIVAKSIPNIPLSEYRKHLKPVDWSAMHWHMNESIKCNLPWKIVSTENFIEALHQYFPQYRHTNKPIDV